jgi:hypothetical protein
LRLSTSASVHTGWSGMVISSPVNSPANSKEARRCDVFVETAMILPN